MIKLIVGLKGTGKTKHLIELANRSVETSPGNVVCIEKGSKLIFDIRHQVRLVDTDEYSIKSAGELYGLVCGILSANFDIKDMYIDSALKICQDKMDEYRDFVLRANALAAKFEVNIVMTSSVSVDDIPEDLKKFII